VDLERESWFHISGLEVQRRCSRASEVRSGFTTR
jgi:hypothetical protein